jgi:hypothetical protein
VHFTLHVLFDDEQALPQLFYSALAVQGRSAAEATKGTAFRAGSFFIGIQSATQRLSYALAD